MFSVTVGSDERVAVAVAADPGAEDQARDVSGGAEQIERQAGVAPGFGEMQVEPVDGGREKVAQVVGGIAQLAGDVRADEVDFRGAPEGFQGGDDPFADAAALAFGVFRELVAHHFIVERAVAFADAGAFGLGRVGGEHGFDLHVLQDFEDLLRRQADRPEVAQRLRPQAADRFRAERFFPLAADFRGHALLDHVEELETDRVKLRQAFRRGTDFRLAAGPGQIGQQVRLARALQRIFQAAEQVLQSFVDQVESFQPELLTYRFACGVLSCAADFKHDPGRIGKGIS